MITKEFPPWNIGGIATWAEALAVRFQEYGTSQVTVLVKGRGIDKNLISLHSKIRFIFMRGHSWKKYYYLYTYFYLRKYLRKHSNAVIIAATWRLARPAVRLKSRYNGFLITATHGMEVSQLNQRNAKEQKQFETVAHGSDAIIAVSEYTQKQIHNICSIKPVNTYCIPNGTDPEIYVPPNNSRVALLRTQYQIDTETKVLLTLARVVPRKGHDIVISALSQVIKIYPNLIYIIAGPERRSWKDHLEMLVSELQLEGRIRFFGAASEQQKLDLYQLCDIYVMVSKSPIHTGDSEGFGITFLEANACGKPVIGSNTGGIPDAVEHNVSGLLVEPDNVDQTAEAVLNLLLNDKLRVQLGCQGRKRVEKRYTWDYVVREIYQIINTSGADIAKPSVNNNFSRYHGKFLV